MILVDLVVLKKRKATGAGVYGGSPPSNSTVALTRLHHTSLTIRMSLDEIETVQVHDLGPCRDKVFHKLLLRVRERVNLRERPKLGM